MLTKSEMVKAEILHFVQNDSPRKAFAVRAETLRCAQSDAIKMFTVMVEAFNRFAQSNRRNIRVTAG